MLVGDEGVGKTVLLSSFTNTFPGDNVTMDAGSCGADMIVNNKPIRLSFWDTEGREGVDRFRPLWYPYTDIFLVCYSASDKASWEHVESKWHPEITLHCPGTPFLLIATKSDLATDPVIREALSERSQTIVSREEGQHLADTLGAHQFMECSALTREGLQEVFEVAARVPVWSKPKSKSFLSSVFSSLVKR